MKQARSVPADQGMEGELLTGPGAAPGQGDGGSFRGYTYRGDYGVDPAPAARRAVSAYLSHARPTAGAAAHVIDVYA